jgi:hypothetical protein
MRILKPPRTSIRRSFPLDGSIIVPQVRHPGIGGIIGNALDIGQKVWVTFPVFSVATQGDLD